MKRKLYQPVHPKSLSLGRRSDIILKHPPSRMNWVGDMCASEVEADHNYLLHVLGFEPKISWIQIICA